MFVRVGHGSNFKLFLDQHRAATRGRTMLIGDVFRRVSRSPLSDIEATNYIVHITRFRIAHERAFQARRMKNRRGGISCTDFCRLVRSLSGPEREREREGKARLAMNYREAMRLYYTLQKRKQQPRADLRSAGDGFAAVGIFRSLAFAPLCLERASRRKYRACTRFPARAYTFTSADKPACSAFDMHAVI